jgi:DNA-binding transcriptional ArsR family regulator
VLESAKDIKPTTTIAELEGWQLISPNQREARKTFVERERKMHKEREFVFMKKDFFNKAKEGLNLGEVGLLLFLARYMVLGEEGKLVHKTQRLTVSDIAKLVKKSDRQIERVLNELEKRSLVYRVKEGRNVFVGLSEELFVCGSLKGEDVKTVKVFKVKLSEVAKKLSLNELGLFMLMLENVHWKTHVLCENPDELETKQLILWRRRDLGEALGVGRNFVGSTLRKLKDIKAIAEVSTVNEGIVLHPNIVSRQPITPSWNEIVDAIDNGLTKENYKKN